MWQGDEHSQKRRKLQAMLSEAKDNYSAIEKHTRAITRSSKTIARCPISRLGQKSNRIFFEAAVLYRLTLCWRTVHDFLDIHAKHYVTLVGHDSTERQGQERSQVETALQEQADQVDIVLGNVDDPLHFKLSRFVAECKLFHWLLSVNCRGITPTTCTVIEQYVMVWSSDHRSAQFLDHLSNLTNNPRAQEAWAKSFRDKFLLKYRKLPVQPPLADATITIRVRVSVFVCIWFHF